MDLADRSIQEEKKKISKLLHLNYFQIKYFHLLFQFKHVQCQ